MTLPCPIRVPPMSLTIPPKRLVKFNEHIHTFFVVSPMSPQVPHQPGDMPASESVSASYRKSLIISCWDMPVSRSVGIHRGRVLFLHAGSNWYMPSYVLTYSILLVYPSIYLLFLTHTMHAIYHP